MRRPKFVPATSYGPIHENHGEVVAVSRRQKPSLEPDDEPVVDVFASPLVMVAATTTYRLAAVDPRWAGNSVMLYLRAETETRVTVCVCVLR